MSTTEVSVSTLPSPSSLGDRFDYLIDGGRVIDFEIACVTSRACCDQCYREDNLVTTMIAKLLAYWNGSMVQSCIDLVYTIGKIEVKARTFLTKEVVEEILGINLDDQIVETMIDIHVSDWPNPYGFRQSHILFPLAYNEWTKQSLGYICWTAELQ